MGDLALTYRRTQEVLEQRVETEVATPRLYVVGPDGLVYERGVTYRTDFDRRLERRA